MPVVSNQLKMFIDAAIIKSSLPCGTLKSKEYRQ